MRPITLSPRLGTVAKLVPPGVRFADIGTDHAYLPVWLLQHGVIERAIAADLNSGPLDRARENAKKYGLTDRISFRLGDGLGCVSPGEADVIAIAGMGGETIAAILAAAPWTAQGDHLLLLQPMSALDDLRRWLSDSGYTIQRELLCRDGGTRYTVLAVTAGQMPPLTPAEIWAGRQSRDCPDPLRGELLEDLIRRAGRALAGIRQSARPSDVPRRAELEAVYSGLIQMKEEWDAWQR